ncbi:MAG: radical SAM protein [Proteobacteria bacterium]|nr:radical SAM protein [Pseudomonadota bacterium]MBU1708502.1 radical SAM protein [Pseudomonadota bacterium]
MKATRKKEHCHSATRALCNLCGALCDAKIVFSDDKVFLVKWCPDHGESRALVCSDVEWYLRSLSYVKPGTNPANRAINALGPCPGSCGLCPRHQQHTCVPILEITDQCNMKCPICLVAGRVSEELSPEQVNTIIDNLLRYEEKINMLTLSGGEPTCHPRFLEIVDLVLRPEIGLVSVSTNGLLLSQDDRLICELRDRGVVISLQFDGFSPEVYQKLRGNASLAEMKRKLVEKIISLGGQVSLTVTLARGVNEQELGEILDLFFAHDEILSIMIQPFADTCRAHREMPRECIDAVTIPEVVKLLAGASGGVIQEKDFTPLPCSHPGCFALTYLLKTAEGRFVSLPSILPAEDYLDMIKNQALMNTDWQSLAKIKDALYALWSSDGIVPDREAVLKTVRKILLELNAFDNNSSHRKTLDIGLKNIKSIFIHHFMDRATFDLSRAVKCCNHYPQADGRLLPACVRNNLM